MKCALKSSSSANKMCRGVVTGAGAVGSSCPAADRASLESGRDALPPPLQPNLAEHRFAYRFAHPGNLVIERVKREQRLAASGRSEECSLKAVVVVTADERGDRRKAAKPKGTAFPFRRFPVN